MTLALLLALAAGPKAQTCVAQLHWEERLKVTSRGQTVADDTVVDARTKLKREADVLSVEPEGYPPFTVREDAGAPVFVFKEQPSSLAVAQVLKRAFGRLVVADSERAAMSSCTADTEAATGRFLKTAVARLNGSEPADVELSKLVVKCTPTKVGTKLDVAFSVSVPRATIVITMDQRGTLLVDRAVWFTQWKVAGPVRVKGDDVAVEGTFASSLVITAGR